MWKRSSFLPNSADRLRKIMRLRQPGRNGVSHRILSSISNRQRTQQIALFRTIPMLRSLHDEDRTRRMFHDALGGAADKQPRDCPSPVRSNDDQVNIEMF